MKILIIEDEKMPREGLYKILKNKYYGIQILPPQTNGKNGLKSIELEKPEIILTDISMPNMNGLEMISKIVKDNYNPYIIILSGYSNFEFAQTALSLGVKEYILKPFKLVDIIKKVDFAIEEVSLSNMHRSEIKLKEESDTTSQYCSKLLIRYKKDYELFYIIQTIVSFLGKYLGPSVFINHSIDEKKQIILFSIYYNEKKIEELFPTKEELSHRFSLLLDDKIIGFMIKHDELIDKQYLLNDLLYAHCFLTIPDIAYLSDISINTNKNNQFLKNYEEEKKLSKAISDKNTEECISYLNNWIEEKIKQEINPSVIYKDLKKYLYKIHNQLINNSQIDNIETIIINIKNCFNLKQLKVNLNTIFIFEKEEERKNLGINNALIKQTLTLIEDSIFNPIYLDEIAVQLNVSSEHLSRLFKEELKIGFNQYVNSRKIEFSKKYLREDELKVSEISDILGFSSPRYFCKVFKKITGITSKEYKKQCNV